MDVFDAIRGRRSVRKWKTDKVPLTLLKKLVDAGRWAPSSCNRQPLKFIIVTDRKLIVNIGRMLIGGRDFVSRAPALILVFADIRPYIFPTETFAHLQDGAAAIQNILLVAHSIGLGACWIFLTSLSLTSRDEIDLRKSLEVPQHYDEVGLIALGYPDDTPSPPSRRRMDKIVGVNRFK